MSTTRILQFTGADLRVTKLGVSSNVEVGSANLFVDTSTGRVGVGTGTPSQALDVSGNVQVGTANLFVDTTTGYVGVGTTEPDTALEVSGNIKRSGATYTKAYLYISVTANDNLYIGRFSIYAPPAKIDINDSGSALGSGSRFSLARHYDRTPLVQGFENSYYTTYEFYYQAVSTSIYDVWFRPNRDGNYRIRIDAIGFTDTTEPSSPTLTECEYGAFSADGKLGVGLMNPGTPLHVSSPNFVSDAVGPASSANTVVRFSSTESDSTLLFGLSANASYISSFSKTGFNTERQIILNANGGNVGIGTKLPTSLLDVNGVIKQVGASWSIYNDGLSGGSNGTLGGAYAYLNDQAVEHRNCTITQEPQGNPSANTRTRVTITVSGRYFIYFNGFRQNNVSSTSMEVQLHKNGSYIEIRAYNAGGNSGESTTGYLTAGGQAVILDLAEDDYLELQLENQVHGNESTYFSGHLIGA